MQAVHETTESAWETEGELTKHGLLEYDEVFRGIDCLDFNISIVEKELCFECSVRRNVGKNKSVGNMVIAKEPIRESYFGTCTCGVDTRNAVPCQHMAAAVMSCRIPQLTQNNIMPYWWRLDHWRLQLLLEVVAECNVSMETYGTKYQHQMGIIVIVPVGAHQTRQVNPRRTNGGSQCWRRQQNRNNQSNVDS
jgi:hypothetical protein